MLDCQTITPLDEGWVAHAVLERVGAVVERIRPDELHELARSWGFTVDEAEAEQLLAIADVVFQAFDLLESAGAGCGRPRRGGPRPGTASRGG